MDTSTRPRPPGRLGTLQDAAERYATSTRSIRRMISRGNLTAYRLPGVTSVRIDLDELDAKLRPIPTVDPGAR